MKIGEHIVVETITKFLPYSVNWLYELFSFFPDKPKFFVEFRDNDEQFDYENLVYISRQNKGIRLITEIKYYLKFHFLFGKKKVLIHSHFGPKGYYDYILYKKWNVNAKQIVSFYGYDLSALLKEEKWKKRYLKLGKEVDMFLVLGEHMKSKLVEIGIDEHKIKVFHLGVDFKKMNSQNKELSKEKPIHFIAVGRFTRKKALPLVVKAFKKYLDINENARLIIVGDSDGSADQEMEKNRILDEVNGDFKDKIQLLGVLDYSSMIKCIDESDILLHPSITSENGDEEGTPLVIINSMALGVPTISTNHSDIKEIISNNKNGFLVQENDIDALVNAMITLSSNHELYDIFSKESRKKIERYFNLEIQSEELTKIYKSILG